MQYTLNLYQATTSVDFGFISLADKCSSVIYTSFNNRMNVRGEKSHHLLLSFHLVYMYLKWKVVTLFSSAAPWITVPLYGAVRYLTQLYVFQLKPCL